MEISDEFSFNFFNSGVMREGQLLTIDTIPKYEEPTPLRNIVEDVVTENHYLTDEQVNKFKYLRGPKKLKEPLKMDMNIFSLKVECLRQIP